MMALLIYLALLGGQRLSLRNKPAIQLPPHSTSIWTDYGGQVVQLFHAEKVLTLPSPPPTVDKEGHPWAVDVKNLGPSLVDIQGKHGFEVQVSVGQTVHIHSDGIAYRLER